MAKKSTKKAKKDGDVEQLKTDIKAGLSVDKSLLGPGGALLQNNGFLGRVDENVDTTALNQTQAAAQSAGTNSTEQNAALDNLRKIAESAGIRSADIQQLIDRRRADLDTAGTTTPEMAAQVAEAQRRYDTSQTINPLVQEAIDRSRAGLAGFDSAESQAFLEGQTGQANKAVSGALRGASGGIAASGLKGSFGNATRSDILKDYARTQMDARNQLAVANANLQDSRLAGFTNLANVTDQNLYARGSDTFNSLTDLKSFLDKQNYDRKTAAQKLFEDSVTGAETNEFNRSLSSGQTYDQAVESNTINNRADVDNKVAAWRAELGRVSDDSLRRAMTNINTLASEISTRTGLVLGVPQQLTAVRNARAANKIAEKQIAAMGGAAGGGGGEGGGGGGDASGFNNPDLSGKLQTSTGVGFNTSAAAPSFQFGVRG